MRVKARKILRSIVSMICMCICISMFGVQMVQAANPRVMVSDYSIEEGEVCSGETFTLHITLKNTAAKTVKNVKLTLLSEQGELLPVSGAGTAYIEKIEAGKEEEFVFSMMAIEGLEEKSYKLSVKTEYEDGNGVEYTVEEAVFIPVGLEQRVSVTDIYIPESYIELGDTVEVTAKVNNLGDGTLYNVTARLEGSNIAEAESYIGNIESGKSGTIDVLSKASGVSKQFGDVNEIIVTYEDRKGTVHEERFEIGISVSTPTFENLEKIKETPNVGGVVKTILIVVVIVLVVAGIVWMMIQRYRRKKKILEEF